ncbi:hypothetical protein CL633_03980 [bacterium]|nr:hypothetical protein [bacterium]
MNLENVKVAFSLLRPLKDKAIKILQEAEEETDKEDADDIPVLDTDEELAGDYYIFWSAALTIYKELNLENVVNLECGTGARTNDLEESIMIADKLLMVAEAYINKAGYGHVI